ncbi:transcription factor Tfb4 [Nadsonia fulvescens var. elongata DSM 6958]|uniref:General transcription and DNA repair factor IIH subunit TFB4 n=1 Tax=Nadsonia fulvescens var. elongata DSM 6958 TaxID=857566 RepID=A0A1E3PNW4_9ASCO|nr:transcription factor Tfb4 [Nadsonia fulvescens var. elongata DSM 6958]
MNAVDDTSNLLHEHDQLTPDDIPSLLTIIIETHPGTWTRISDSISFKSVLSSLLIFINAHLALHNNNKVAVIASHTDYAKFIYPPEPVQPTKGSASNSYTNSIPNGNNVNSRVESSNVSNGTNSNMYRQFREVNEAVMKGLEDLMVPLASDISIDTSESFNEHDYYHESKSAIAGALSLALAYTNTSLLTNDDQIGMRARFLILSVCEDLSFQYIPTMNAIFAAQRMKIPIDVCKLSGDTIFLQQASDTTGGIYMKIQHPDGLIQYLLSAFIIDPNLRQHVNLPTQKDVDFRAECFVTKRAVDVAYVCSVCLCIISIIPSSGHCPTCSTKFDSSTLLQLLKKPVVSKKKLKKKKKAITVTPSNGAVVIVDDKINNIPSSIV